ncbi:hypothetical protein [Blastococcus sp. TF02A-30]|uniref:hypothetical protein n=1 Tax=Blastococcus sp. TF02A-30 TaxID=2250580 RepID=UPI000DE9B5E0|nr:hypothetical protein [Blastococcus sp. TF02A-30]RBY85742.1 hypothetical protein DQ241_15800 [Blastococcus sp. TF02A-30]
MSAYAKSGFAKDANGRTYEERMETQRREDLEAENARLRRRLRESARQAPSTSRPFRGWR